MIKQIDHLGIAVRSLDETVPVYEKALGLRCEHREEVPSQKVRTAFFDVGGVHLELLEPTAPESPIAKFLADRGEGIHHLAFRTDDITSQLEQAAGAGVRLKAGLGRSHRHSWCRHEPSDHPRKILHAHLKITARRT